MKQLIEFSCPVAEVSATGFFLSRGGHPIMNTASTRLLLITGFLGSGKTTLLNRLLELLEGKRVGVVVNEWGDINVDASLIRQSGEEDIIELSGGQLFCSCLSGSFVKAVVKLVGYNLDYIVTEASGLAKPSVLGDIVAEAEKQGKGTLVYDGMICIVDASRYLVLRQVVNAIDEQVAYSDRFIINKVDLADPESLSEIRNTLKKQRPGVPIFEVSSAAVDHAIFDRPSIAPAEENRDFRGWGAGGRPASCFLAVEKPVDREKLLAFLEASESYAWRVKGFLPLLPDGKIHQIDCVGSQISVKEASGEETAEKRMAREPAIKNGIVIIGKNAFPPAEEARSWWKKTVDQECTING
jgi:G3E family GTPase